jgi:hypothetical protein
LALSAGWMSVYEQTAWEASATAPRPCLVGTQDGPFQSSEQTPDPFSPDPLRTPQIAIERKTESGVHRKRSSTWDSLLGEGTRRWRRRISSACLGLSSANATMPSVPYPGRPPCQYNAGKADSAVVRWECHVNLELADLFFGCDDAELDIAEGGLLRAGFLPIPAYEAVRKGRKHLIIGRKGSGKSASRIKYGQEDDLEIRFRCPDRQASGGACQSRSPEDTFSCEQIAHLPRRQRRAGCP